jgi:hypothetical protein
VRAYVGWTSASHGTGQKCHDHARDLELISDTWPACTALWRSDGAASAGVTCPVAEGGVVDFRSAQKLAWENKLAKGFNTTDVPLEFCLLSGEVAEAFDAWRKGRDDLAEELADAALFLVGLAQMVGADLQEAVEAKLAKNAARAYQQLPNGVLVKSGTAAPPA